MNDSASPRLLPKKSDLAQITSFWILEAGFRTAT
jgi:hypothetical protein